MQETEIVESVRSGNTRAIRHLYSENTKKMIVSHILKNSGSEDDGIEMHQLAVIKFYEKCLLKDFELTSKISTYLFSIAKNLWLKKLRDNREYANDDFSRFALLDEDESDVNQERIVLMSDCIKRLGDACKKLIAAFYYNKLSIIEIKEKFGYNTENAVKASKSRCMKQLKQFINNEGRISRTNR
jgi:RNA polymerase sigma factor (sigma-70 family)